MMAFSRRHLLALLAAPAAVSAQPPAGKSGRRPPGGAGPGAASKAGQGAVEFRRVPAWPAPASGPVTTAMLQEALQPAVEGLPAKALRVLGPESDMLLFLVLDLVGDLAFVDPARQALIAELRALPGNVWPAVFRAQDGLRVATDPARDPAPAIAAIENTQISGRAGLLETVEPAVRLADALLAKSPVRLAILYITDSNIYNYREDYTNPVINPSDSRDLSRRFPEGLIRERTTKLADTLTTYDAPVFIVHLAFLRDRLNEAYQNGLQLIAESTGGALSMCRTPNDVPTVIHTVFERLLGHFAVDLEVPPAAPRNFTVQLNAPSISLQHRTRFSRGR
jgi:hypothetical protein